MRLIRRIAHLGLDLNKIQTEALVRLYGRLGLYKKLYVACGLPEEVAGRLEERMIGALFRGVEEQHVVVSSWVKGAITTADFVDRYKDWFREYMDRCGRIIADELIAA